MSNLTSYVVYKSLAGSRIGHPKSLWCFPQLTIQADAAVPKRLINSFVHDQQHLEALERAICQVCLDPFTWSDQSFVLQNYISWLLQTVCIMCNQQCNSSRDWRLTPATTFIITGREWHPRDTQWLPCPCAGQWHGHHSTACAQSRSWTRDRNWQVCTSMHPLICASRTAQASTQGRRIINTNLLVELMLLAGNKN
jgi:hypothetical protein